MKARTPNPRLKAALENADNGFPVFPVHWPKDSGCSCKNKVCTRVGKHPKTEHGVKDATTDKKTIRGWWKTYPDANVGMAVPKNHLVIDVDPRNGGMVYLPSLGELPITPTSSTGGGGFHYIFSTSLPVKNITGLLPGIDIKAHGGYIVAPPSVHLSGDTYEWIHPLNECDPAPLPPVVAELIQGDKVTTAACLIAPHWDDGTRHEMALPLAGFLARRGVSKDVTTEIFKRLCQMANDQEIDDRLRAVSDTYKNLAAGSALITSNVVEYLPPEVVERLNKLFDGGLTVPARTTYSCGTPYTLRGLEALNLPPVSWLAAGFLPRLPVIAFASDPGAGKSWLAMYIGLCLSAGVPVFDQYDVGQPNKVVYLDAENPRGEGARRLLALRRGMGLPDDIPFVYRPGVRLDLCTPEAIRVVEDCLEEESPTVVIIDSLVDVHSADENAANQMTQVLNAIRDLAEKFEASFMPLHHMRKKSQASSNDSRSRFKGTTNILGACDVAFGLRGDVAGGLTIDVAKQRVLTLPQPICVVLKDFEDVAFRFELIGQGEAAMTTRAKSFILDFLADGEKAREDIEAEATARGLRFRPVDDCLRKMGGSGELTPRMEGRAKYYSLP